MIFTGKELRQFLSCVRQCPDLIVSGHHLGAFNSRSAGNVFISFFTADTADENGDPASAVSSWPSAIRGVLEMFLYRFLLLTLLMKILTHASIFCKKSFEQ